jgi:hypothetical protein
MNSMAFATYRQANEAMEISYGIYTVERLPKGLKRSPKWDLHSTAKDKKTAEDHAKILAAQPYFDIVEVQEFRTCPNTQKRTAHKIKRYKRQSKKCISFTAVALAMATIALALL